MRKKYKSQTYAAQLMRQRMRSVLWSNDQPTDEAKERMKKWNDYLQDIRHGNDTTMQQQGVQ